MIELAQLVVKDGEGAQKFITVSVSGAQSDEAARRIGLAVANSPLVKTAIAGEDANLGPHRDGGGQERREGRP